MRILTVCAHGNVRSVAMAYLIKTIYHHEHEVIPIGVKDITSRTLDMLIDWSDKIVVMDKLLVATIASPKVFVADVGEDVWHNPFAQELQHKLLKHLKELDL